MEYSYYRDARHHYLTVPCPDVETYQYRMLAANRMDMVIPCSIRSVDGKRYLYYDITARENMEEFFREHGSASQEIARLLYAIADVGAVLERYLLDSSRVMLGPEFVFYDYTRGEFRFLYYPEDPEEPTGPAFYEYLADHADPQDKMLYYTLLRLISISANKTYVLQEGFLRHSLGRERPEEKSIDPGREGSAQIENVWQEAVEDDGRAAGISAKFASDRVDIGTFCEETDRERTVDTAEVENPERQQRKGAGRLALYPLAAVIMLAGAIGLAWARLNVPAMRNYDAAGMVAMIACLSASILTAVYGAYRGLRSSRQELQGVKEHMLWERKNALEAVDNFR